MPTATDKTVMVVSDATDGALRNAVARLRDSGYLVSLIQDVYSAMAKLANGEAFDRVLVDTRNLSDSESSFVKLAPRYFPAVDVEVLELETGSIPSAERAHTIYAPTVESLVGRSTDDVPEIQPTNPMTHREKAQSPKTTPTEPPLAPDAVSPVPVEPAPVSQGKRTTPWTTLSTDGDADNASTGPSLHEAVRNRMAGNDPRTVRRRPPSPKPPTDKPKPPSDSAGSSIPEDLDTFFSPDEPDDFEGDEEGLTDEPS